MRQDLLVDFFRRQESQPECWKSNVLGVPVWPFVRVQVYFNWRSKSGVPSVFRSGLRYDPAKLRGLQSAVSHPSSNKRILFISREDGLTDLVDNKLYDRFISSLYLLTNATFDVSLVSVFHKKDRFDDCLDLSGLLNTYAKDVSLRVNKTDLESIEHLLAELPSEFRLDLRPDTVIEKIVYFLLSRAFWSSVFETKRPDLAVTTCFNTPHLMGACAAAHSQGLRMVDLQHGRVGYSHPIMSWWDFRHAPQTVFSLFPSEFWCWERQNAENIEKTWLGFSDHITVKVFGNPWGYMRRNEVIKDESTESSDVLPSNQIVMIALQPIEDSIPQFVVDGLNHFEDFEVWVRPHPHQLGSISDIQAKLSGMGLKNFVIRDRNDLYSELRHVGVLVTAFSTVAVEAQSLGIPVILTHQNAPVAFGDAIDEKTIFYCNRGEDFTDLLTELKGTSKRLELNSDDVTTLAQMMSCF